MLLRSSLAPLAAFLAGIGVLRASTATENYALLAVGLCTLLGAVLWWSNRDPRPDLNDDGPAISDPEIPAAA